MIKKEALSEFQSRLADRLVATEGKQVEAAANWLAVEISGRGFVLPLSQSGEIFPWLEPQAIPHTKDWFLGVANLRGALYGVANLAKFLDLDQPANEDNAKSSTQDRRLIGFHPAFELNTVVVVDKLVGLKSQTHMVTTDQELHFKDEKGQIWREINLEQLSRDVSFISIEQD